MTVSALEQIPKLIAEVERLRRDIATLYEKIEPFAKLPEWRRESHRERKPGVVLDGAPIDLEVREIRKSIRACEHDIGLAVSLLKDISEHAPSREAMKPHIKNPSPKRRT